MIAIPRPSRVIDRARGRLASPGIEPALVAEVLGRLGLAPVGEPRNLGGRRSRNVVVATAGGRVVVKRYRVAWDERTVAYGHSIARRLQELELPGPRLVAAPDGTTIVTVDGRTYAAFDVVRGVERASSYLRRRDRQLLLRRAGLSLGAFHRGLEGFEPQGRHHMAFTSLQGPRVRDRGWYEETVHTLRGAGLPGAGRLEAAADDLVEEIAVREAALAAADPPRTVIHGDFGLHNVLFDGERATPIDLELARLDHRLTDHVLLVGRFLDASPQAPDLDGLTTLLEGAGEAWPLGPDERAAADDAWRFQQLTSAVRGWWSATTSDDPAARVALALRSLDRADWLDVHPAVRDRLFGPATSRSGRG